MLEKSSAGKIVNISSQGLVMYPFIKLRIDDLNCQKKYDPATLYYQKKLALLMLSLYMKENFIGKTKIIAIRVTNVKVDVNRYPNLTAFQKRLYNFKSRFSIAAEEMAKAYVSIVEDDNFAGFYVDEKLREVKANKGAKDRKKQILLVDYLEKITGLKVAK